MRVSVVGIDADDTLWPTSHLYNNAVKEFADALAPWSPDLSAERLVDAHFEKASHYGVGALALLQTMVEAAVSVGLDAAGPACEKALQLVETIHEDDVRPFAGAEAMLTKLREKGLRLVLITLGSAAEQTAKLERSGLAEHFDTVAVFGRKNAEAYRRLLKDLGVSPERFVMFGDSVANDIEPVLEVGGRAVLFGAEGDPRPRGVPAMPYLTHFPDLLETCPPTPYTGALGAMLTMLVTGDGWDDDEPSLVALLVELKNRGLSQTDLTVHVECLRAQNDVTVRDPQVEDRCLGALDLICGYGINVPQVGAREDDPGRRPVSTHELPPRTRNSGGLRLMPTGHRHLHRVHSGVSSTATTASDGTPSDDERIMAEPINPTCGICGCPLRSGPHGNFCGTQGCPRRGLVRLVTWVKPEDLPTT